MIVITSLTFTRTLKVTRLDLQCSQLNDNACRLAHEVAAEGDALVAGGITHSQVYLQGKGKAEVQAVARAQLAALMKNKVDFLIVEVRRGG